MNNQTKKEIDYCYENFIGSHIRSSDPKQKQYQSSQGTQTYNEIPLLYNYGTPEAPIVDQCYIEFPPVVTKGGIVCQKEEKKSKNPGEDNYVKETYSMMFIFDLQNEDNKKFLGKMDELHHGVAQTIVSYKAKIGLRHLDPKNPEATGLKNPVYYKVDQLTNERSGQNPSIWVKLNHWKTNKTLFTDLECQPVDWSLLQDVEATMIPLVHVHQVYSGSTTSIQFKLISAVILSVVPINSVSKQTSTIEKLKQKYSGLASTVASQLAQLRMDKQDSLDNGNVVHTNAKLPSNEMGQMHQSGDTKGFQGNIDQLNEFLGGAPPVSQAPPKMQTVLPGTVPQVFLSTQLPVGVGNTPVQTGVQFQPPSMMSQPQLQIQTGVPVQFGNNSQPMLQIQ